MSAYSDMILAEASLINYWRLNETSGTSAADSKGTATGTYAGGVTLNQPGAIAGDSDPGATFDGVNDVVTLGNPASLAGLGNNWSLECWCFPTAAPEGSGLIVAVYPGSTSTFRFLLGFDASSGPTVHRSRPDMGIYDGTWREAREASDVPLNVWHHMVGTYDGTTIRLYRNGVQTASLAFGGGTPANTTTYQIGQGGSPRDKPFFPGSIDEVAVYNTALSPQRVLEHYYLGLGRPTTRKNVRHPGRAA